ncbi:MAG: hypothetical protein R3E89_05680 [Thiolinea sp.]
MVLLKAPGWQIREFPRYHRCAGGKMACSGDSFYDWGRNSLRRIQSVWLQCRMNNAMRGNPACRRPGAAKSAGFMGRTFMMACSDIQLFDMLQKYRLIHKAALYQMNRV